MELRPVDQLFLVHLFPLFDFVDFFFLKYLLMVLLVRDLSLYFWSLFSFVVQKLGPQLHILLESFSCVTSLMIFKGS